MPDHLTTTTEQDHRPFDLGQFGLAQAWTEPDGTGAVIYHVSAPRITVAVSIRVTNARSSSRRYQSVSVGYGVDTYHSDDPASWPDRLTVNGIRLYGRSEVRAEHLPSFGGPGDPSPLRRVKRLFGHHGGSAPAPEAAVERTCALVVALLFDFIARPDLDQVYRAAAANEARAELADVQRSLARLDTSIAEDLAARRAERIRSESLIAVVESHPWPDEAIYRLPGLQRLHQR